MVAQQKRGKTLTVSFYGGDLHGRELKLETFPPKLYYLPLDEHGWFFEYVYEVETSCYHFKGLVFLGAAHETRGSFKSKERAEHLCLLRAVQSK